MKLDKNTVQRRIDLMAEEGVTFACNTEVGSDATSLMDDFDAVVLAIGSTVPNNLPIPGRELDGIHFAMEFLTANQKRYDAAQFLGAQFSRAILGARNSRRNPLTACLPTSAGCSPTPPPSPTARGPG